mgnify:CR=1 FL=1
MKKRMGHGNAPVTSSSACRHDVRGEYKGSGLATLRWMLFDSRRDYLTQLEWYRGEPNAGGIMLHVQEGDA